MSIQLYSEDSRRFSYIDGFDNYITLDSSRAENTEGLIYKNQTILCDFAIITKKDGYTLVYSRFKDTRTAVDFDSFTITFLESNAIVQCALFSNCLYFNCKKIKPKINSLVLLCSNELAKKLDRNQCYASKENITISKPTIAELLQLTKIYGKKAIYARIVSFETQGELYISLEHSSATAKKKAKKLLQQDAFFSHSRNIKQKLSHSDFSVTNSDFTKAVAWSKFSSLQFLNANNKGLWAGLPWFRDYWGRDTFISMPGALLLSGNYERAEQVFYSCIKHQNTSPRSVTYGRLPNIYKSSNDVLYNTADATLWFVREVLEFARYTGNKKFLEKTWSAVFLALECDRTLRTDSAGFLLHGDADTWMDARIFGEKSFSPRGNRANDIQALWFTALLCGSEIAKILKKDDIASIWNEAAQKVKGAFLPKFFDGKKMADCILRDDTPDYRIRPNQLMLITIPQITGQKFIPQEVELKITENAIHELLFPYGICSLSQNDPYFHPYHDTSSLYHKDAAYHNGTIWNWNIGFTIGSLINAGYKELAWQLTKNISNHILNVSTVGSMAANISAYPNEDGSLHFSGAYSTCKGNAEFVKSAWQYFLGLQVDLLKNEVTISPAFPNEWEIGSAEIALGQETKFTLKLNWEKSGVNQWNIIASTSGEKINLKINVKTKDNILCKELKAHNSVQFNVPLAPSLRGLGFTFPYPTDRNWKKPKCLLQKNYLSEITLANKFNGDHPTSLTEIKS